ncbi:MAG: hypothetical protein LBT14_07975 [Treponema sp.]|jgi:hypothetical protein|nr:hypothetical protein [Treponema sp.]
MTPEKFSVFPASRLGAYTLARITGSLNRSQERNRFRATDLPPTNLHVFHAQRETAVSEGNTKRMYQVTQRLQGYLTKSRLVLLNFTENRAFLREQARELSFDERLPVLNDKHRFGLFP